jgi:hypothetical protein
MYLSFGVRGTKTSDYCGQSERAIFILKTFARVNKRRPAESVFQQLKVNGSTVLQVNCFVFKNTACPILSWQVSTEEARLLVANEPVHTALDLLKTPRLRRNTIILTLLWFLWLKIYLFKVVEVANLSRFQGLDGSRLRRTCEEHGQFANGCL